MENKKELVRRIRTHDLTRITLKSYPLYHKMLFINFRLKIANSIKTDCYLKTANSKLQLFH